MLAQPVLDEALQSVPTKPVDGLWARYVAHDHVLAPPPGAPAGSVAQSLWPGGPALAGARYTPKGGASALYLAQTAEVAQLEVGAVVDIGGRVQLAGSRPYVLLQVKVQLNAVLDLLDERVRATLGTNLQELTGNWRLAKDVPTHVLGAAAAACGRFDGLVAPSSKQPARAILVVFTDRLSDEAGTFCEVVEGGALTQRIPPRAPA
jgi:RES domain-containing protein